MRFLFLFFIFSKIVCQEADLIVFSYNRPMQLYALLESVQKRAVGFREIAVISRIDSIYEKQYEMIQRDFPDIHFVRQSNVPKEDFKPLLMSLLFGRDASYVVFAVDDMILTDEIDIERGISKLQETGAYAVYYRLGSHIDYFYMLDRPQKVPPLLDVGDHCFAWEMNKAEYEWAYPNTVDFALYRKKDVQEALCQMDFTNPSELEGLWAMMGTRNQLGLCYNRAKTINIPLNIVSTMGWDNRASHRFSPEILNRLFSSGLKIDIDKFYRVMNKSVHVDYIPDFVRRGEAIKISPGTCPFSKEN